jgi:crossover junction endodeoxyribonuclease RuvC
MDEQAHSGRQPAEARVLGVDPGLNRTGYCVLARTRSGPHVLEAGVLRSTQGLPLAERVLEIARSLREVFDQYSPEVVAIEQVFSTGKFPKSALLMAHARGAILCTAAERGARVVHYTPRQIKRLLTGSGKASKEQVARAICNELRLARLLAPFDVSDAAAAALCHYHSVRLPAAALAAGSLGKSDSGSSPRRHQGATRKPSARTA